VLAVPGNILSGRNRGAHALLKDGAKIVESADDIFEELGMSAAAAPRGQTPSVIGTRGSDPADPVLDSLVPGEACDLDEISERSGMKSASLLPRLFELEMQGLVRRAGGGRFVRLDSTC
jgi:DNA processing protein